MLSQLNSVNRVNVRNIQDRLIPNSLDASLLDFLPSKSAVLKLTKILNSDEIKELSLDIEEKKFQLSNSSSVDDREILADIHSLEVKRLWRF